MKRNKPDQTPARPNVGAVTSMNTQEIREATTCTEKNSRMSKNNILDNQIIMSMTGRITME